jgi:NAD(P)-dependent dehydrogenase (short-subunit alcohol dehydrogenase family)
MKPGNKNAGRRVVITGVSRGLGRAMALGMIKAGCTVIGCARTTDAMEKLANEYGRPHRFDVVDIVDAEQVRRWAAEVLREGPVDLLINNAALINENNSLWSVPVDEFSRIIDVNIKGMFHVIHAFVPSMATRQQGVIVNFSSTWGRTTAADEAPYCATKWAVEGLTRSMAQELPDGMAAVPFNPGVINTDMLRTCFGAGAGNYSTPQEWAKRAVPYLLSLNASHNGEPVTLP